MAGECRKWANILQTLKNVILCRNHVLIINNMIIFLNRSKRQKSIYFHLAAVCKNILELCVVKVSQPGGMNLEFAICLVDEESAAGATGCNRGWGRVQLQVKRTWQSWPGAVWETHTEGTWSGDMTNDHGRGHIKSTLFKIGHLWISHTYGVFVRYLHMNSWR